MAFVRELNKETIDLPLGCLQGGSRVGQSSRPGHKLRLGAISNMAGAASARNNRSRAAAHLLGMDEVEDRERGGEHAPLRMLLGGALRWDRQQLGVQLSVLLAWCAMTEFPFARQATAPERNAGSGEGIFPAVHCRGEDSEETFSLPTLANWQPWDSVR